MRFNQDGAISSLNSMPMNLVDYFAYFGSNISFTESDVNLRRGKAMVNNHMELLFYKINSGFFQVVTVLVLLYGCTLYETPGEKATWKLHKTEILKAAPHKTATVRPLGADWECYRLSGRRYNGPPPPFFTVKCHM